MTIPINHHKLELLCLLEEIVHHNARLKLWIKIVLDLFCPALFNPVEANHFVDDALGVRLAECVQVLKPSA